MNVSKFVLKSANTIKRLVEDPTGLVGNITAFMRGLYYIIYFRIFRRNVRIGFPFSAFASVSIVGPGSVVIGSHCYAAKNVFKGWSIVTHCKSASVNIGEQCVLGGLTIRCKTQIDIGNRTMSANSLIQDYFFTDEAATDRLRSKGLLPPPKPVTLNDNVWVGAHCVVVSGTSIGRDSVLSAGAGCYDMTVDDYCLVIGNPAKKPLPIEKLLKLKGEA